MHNPTTKEISHKLEEVGATIKCARCAGSSFAVLDDFSVISIQHEIQGLSRGGQGIPVTNIACKTCGAITQHALGALGFLDTKKNGTNNE